MATTLKRETVVGALGTFDVSTIRTFSGTPWPFETMVFKPGSITGLFHAPYATETDALSGHALIVETIKQGLEFGGGVQGPFGIPSTTPEEWQARIAGKEGRNG